MKDKLDLLLVKPVNQKKLYGELSTALAAHKLPFSAIEPLVLAGVIYVSIFAKR